MKTILFIDSVSSNEVKIGLKNNDKTMYLSSKTKLLKSQAVLPLIDALLKKNSLTIYDIKGVEVLTGPGSFTGLRVGIAIANALSYTLKIRVNGKKLGEFIIPTYEAQPQ